MIYKPKVLLLLIMMLFYLGLVAQHKPFQFGFKASGNIGWYGSVNDDYKNEGVNLGASWGFTADFFLMENYSITTGFDVLYLNGTQSYPHKIQSKVGALTREYKTKYIKLPIIFTMKTNKIGKLKYYGQIGFGFGILLTAKASDEFVPNNGGNSETSTENIYDDIRKTRESVILGAGVEMPVHKSTYARFGILFDNAFVNILKGNNQVDTSEKNNGRNSFIEINASLFF